MTDYCTCKAPKLNFSMTIFLSYNIILLVNIHRYLVCFLSHFIFFPSREFFNKKYLVPVL